MSQQHVKEECINSSRCQTPVTKVNVFFTVMFNNQYNKYECIYTVAYLAIGNLVLLLNNQLSEVIIFLLNSGIYHGIYKP